MVNKKISELDPAATITGTEVVPLLQAGATKAATVQQLLALITAAAPGNLDTFFEVATQMGLDETTVTTLQALVAGKADATTVAATYATRSLLSGAYPMRGLAMKVAALNAGTAQVKWLTFGDSYAQKIWQQVSDLVINTYGGVQAGTVFAGFNGVTTNTDTGTITANPGDFAHWPSGVTYTLGAGASRTFGMNGGTTVCDTIKVYWINAGGGFKIQVDGVDNLTPTVTTAGTLGVATIAVAHGPHTVTVAQTSGTPTIVGPGFIDSTVDGVVLINVGQGGINLDQPAPQAWTNLGLFLADITPDVFTFEMKEASTYGDGSTYAQKLATLFGTTAAAAPLMDVVAIGSPPVAVNDADQVAQNVTLAAACRTAGYAYWDSYTIFKDYPTLTALGMNGDGTHVSAAGDLYRGMLLLRDLGILGAQAGRPIAHDLRAKTATVTSALQFGTNTVPVAEFDPDTVFDLDLYLYLKRQLRIRAAGTSADMLVIDGRNNAGAPSSLPQYSQFGAGLAGFVGTSPTTIEARANQGGGMAHPADLTYRTAIPAIHVQSTSGAITADLADGGVHFITLTGNITSFQFVNAVTGGQEVEVQFIQDATGGRTLSGASGWIGWSGGTAPTLTTTANRRDIFRFRVNDGAYWEIGRSMNVG